MTIAEAVAEIDRLRAALESTEKLLSDACQANTTLAALVDILRSQLHTARAAASL
jgi:hypothetical protein